MNNLEQNEKIISGRKKERLVGDALKACREWRQIFDKTGCTLQQAAD